MTANVSMKKNKMRMELTQGGLAIVQLIDWDAKTMYTYIPAQNMAMKMDTGTAGPNPTDIAQYQPVVVGTETLDGKVCLVVEYTAQGVRTKSWIWKDNGFPIRIETSGAQGASVIEFKNIQFTDIPDSVFQLPAGVQITAFPGG